MPIEEAVWLFCLHQRKISALQRKDGAGATNISGTSRVCRRRLQSSPSATNKPLYAPVIAVHKLFLYLSLSKVGLKHSRGNTIGLCCFVFIYLGAKKTRSAIYFRVKI